MACSTHPEPEWIDSQPKAENYWFGVGSVEKPFYGSDIREEARSKALSEIAAQIADSGFEFLDAPVKRVASKDVHIAYSPILEDEILVQTSWIQDAIEELLEY